MGEVISCTFIHNSCPSYPVTEAFLMYSDDCYVVVYQWQIAQSFINFVLKE
jgi:hypothetical protein